jgi:hypothetical protein
MMLQSARGVGSHLIPRPRSKPPLHADGVALVFTAFPPRSASRCAEPGMRIAAYRSRRIDSSSPPSSASPPEPPRRNGDTGSARRRRCRRTAGAGAARRRLRIARCLRSTPRSCRWPAGSSHGGSRRRPGRCARGSLRSVHAVLVEARCRPFLPFIGTSVPVALAARGCLPTSAASETMRMCSTPSSFSVVLGGGAAMAKEPSVRPAWDDQRGGQRHDGSRRRLCPATR